MMSQKLIIGRHINTSHGFTTAPAHAKKLGCNILQIFLGPSRQIKYKKKTTEELEKFQKALHRHKLQVVVHGSYTINLCHPLGSTKSNSSINILKQDLEAVHVIGARCLGVIIHMGKNIKSNKISDAKAIQNYVKSLKEVLKTTPPDTTIILETGASQGTEVASKIKGLTKIYDGLTTKEKHRVKFCIDTCHIWATGYDISTITGVKRFFNKFDKSIGVDKIACIHFNDSKTDRNSHVDRHADLERGTIGKIGLKQVAKFALRKNIPIVMETPLTFINPKTRKKITFVDEKTRITNWLRKK